MVDTIGRVDFSLYCKSESGSESGSTTGQTADTRSASGRKEHWNIGAYCCATQTHHNGVTEQQHLSWKIIQS